MKEEMETEKIVIHPKAGMKLLKRRKGDLIMFIAKLKKEIEEHELAVVMCNMKEADRYYGLLREFGLEVTYNKGTGTTHDGITHDLVVFVSQKSITP